MIDQSLLMMLKGIQPDELEVINSVTNEMNEAQQRQFIMFYQSRRKDEQTMLLLTLDIQRKKTSKIQPTIQLHLTV